MELEEQIKMFTNEIINRTKNSNEIKKNVLNYKSFLVNTKMISSNSEISKWLDVIINNARLISNFKEDDGFVDLEAFVESMAIYKAKKNKVVSDPKHYGHYHEVSSSSCGSSRTLVQTDSCGCSYRATNRC